MSIKFVDGSVTAPKGFVASGVHCGIRKNKNKRDLALIYCEKPCTAAAIYTTNLVKSAPILVTRANLENGTAQAVICNSGNANTCNSDGVEVAEKTCALVAKALNIDAKDVIVGSTGVIGQKLPIEPIANSIPELVSALSKEGATNAAEAIMTTDLVKKEYAVETEIGGKTVYIGGIAKGSGMIHPNMATMLCFITTDAAISADMLKIAVKTVADKSFNMVSVDGDTSTNDTLAVMASGLAGNAEITEQNEDYNIFVEALTILCRKLSKEMAKDGEGASKLLVCKVSGAKTEKDAKGVAKSVVCSSLLKAAMFGSDANWGRVLCAIGYSGCDVDINKVDVSFASKAGKVDVCKNGAGIDFSEELAKTVLTEDEIDIVVELNDGNGVAEAYGCDLTYEYVKINGDYRS
ncbi:MAG: bifunctional glutamate N-acetyltransferase/amino-acid acetyltransferase ArgJ [Pseudoruminococcus massiliensis]|jgi:glutamate N-acetyltransferase/amino-acid N-acetyltransferase|uniref:bifunctional glutamate N-acetyltransferase/amino-acid acetyltransferase ArgJ n=1 Tax=Pseudoruminococcus massiliensis TaxID=2086583 RepID=UPI0039955E30|nr:bifunctional glutamate N-acetyltransferase/amino-acid acetyltransferase ArgJ [Oscillospiraceae bacterium]